MLGVEGYLIEDASFLEERAAGKKIKPAPYFHIVIYAKNEIGRKNLYKLISTSHIDTFYRKPLIPRAVLDQHREGLLLGSAC